MKFTKEEIRKSMLLYAVTDRSQEVYIRQGDGRRKVVQVPLDGVLEGVL